MASTLFNYLGSGNNPNQMNLNGSSNNLLQQFEAFKKSVNVADPKAEVERMLASGQMSQETFNTISSMANYMMGRR